MQLCNIEGMECNPAILKVWRNAIMQCRKYGMQSCNVEGTESNHEISKVWNAITHWVWNAMYRVNNDQPCH